MGKRAQCLPAAVVAPALCCLALGAGRPQEGGGDRRVPVAGATPAGEGQDGIGHPGGAKRVPVTGVTLAREGKEEREFRLKEPEHAWGRARLQMRAGDRITLVAIVRPPDATNKDVLWTSSNPAVVAVEDGVVAAKAPGYAVVTATSVEGCGTDGYGISVFSWDRKARRWRGRPAVYRMTEPFDASALRPYMGEGTAAVAGRATIAFVPGHAYLDGPKVIPAASVTVIPAAGGYLAGYVTHLLRGYRIEPPIPKAAEALVRTAPCDAAGDFSFAGLPAGRYCVYGSDPEWGWAELGAVELKAGETKAVAVSN